MSPKKKTFITNGAAWTFTSEKMRYGCATKISQKMHNHIQLCTKSHKLHKKPQIAQKATNCICCANCFFTFFSSSSVAMLPFCTVAQIALQATCASESDRGLSRKPWKNPIGLGDAGYKAKMRGEERNLMEYCIA
jgi:hypothetical protein